MNFYSFHIGDYASHTRHLTLIEDIAYRRMLDLYYTSEKPLPACTEKVARLIGMREYLKEVSDVLSDFFVKSEDCYKNHRCDREIAIYHGKADRAKSANKARWNNEKSADCLKSDVKSDVKLESDQIPTNNHKPLTVNHEPNNKVDDFFNGVSSSVVSNFKKLRKELKAPITDLSIKAIKREADKAGISFEEALILMCENSWRGFKAEWIKKKNNGQFSSLGKAGQVTAMNGLKWLEETNGDS